MPIAGFKEGESPVSELKANQKEDEGFFHIDDPNADPIDVIHVLEKIPYGSFQ